MKVLPDAGPERTRLFVLLVLLGIAGAWAYYRSQSNTTGVVTAPQARTAANVPVGPRDKSAVGKGGARQTAAPPTKPEALKLDVLEKVPDEPQPGRNPFRFGAKPVPPQAPPPPLPPPPTPLPPQPPPPPQVPLKLAIVVDDPYVPGRRRGYFVGPTGAMFEAIDGQTVDGQYRIVKVERTSAIVEFLDGTGRRTIFVR